MEAKILSSLQTKAPEVYAQTNAYFNEQQEHQQSNNDLGTIAEAFEEDAESDDGNNSLRNGGGMGLPGGQDSQDSDYDEQSESDYNSEDEDIDQEDDDDDDDLDEDDEDDDEDDEDEDLDDDEDLDEDAEERRRLEAENLALKTNQPQFIPCDEGTFCKMIF